MRAALSPTAAAELVPDGATVMIGGFMGVGSPHRIIAALVARGARGLTVIANDTARPGVGHRQLVPGMGGAMDLVSGARRVVVAMNHTQKGASKIVDELALPATSLRPVTLVVTEMAVIEPTPEGLVLRETAPGVSIDAVRAATAAALLVPASVREMNL